MLVLDRDLCAKEIRSKCELIVYTVRRVAVATLVQWGEMDHVVSLVGEDFEKLWPVFERSHPFPDDGLDCQAGKREVFAVEFQGWLDGEVMFFGGFLSLDGMDNACLLALDVSFIEGIPFGKRLVFDFVSVRSRSFDFKVDVDGGAEVRLQSTR
jgi:hypothetical protein